MTTETSVVDEDWFQLVFRESLSGIAFLDPDFHFLLANPRFYNLTGYRQDDLLAPCLAVSCPLNPGGEKTILDIVATADHSRVADVFTRASRGEVTGMTPCNLVSPDGSIVSVMLKIAAVKKKGTRSGLIIFLMAEEERKALRAQATKPLGIDPSGPLISEVAYDFNDLLGLILENIELVGKKAQDGEDFGSNIQRALKAGKRAKDLISQLHKFSRQTANTHRPVQVGTVIMETVELLKVSLPPTIEIKVSILNDALVMADPAMIHQIIMNLSSNAEYAMRGKGGLIAIKLEDVLLDADSALVQEGIKEGSYLKLTVADTGSGMSADMIEHIFDPSYIVQEQDKAFGLAFAAVYDIVLSHGGLITVNSEIDKGSTFEILLPVLEKIKDTGEKALVRVSGGKERILFVDDERDFVVMARELLMPLGYEVTTRTNSRDALQLFRENPDKFDLVITDMLMPQVPGDQLAKEIFTIKPGIPIILCTGFGLLSLDEKASEIGIRAIVRKPVILGDLAKTIRKILDEKAPT